MYDLMLECWQRNDVDRPNFREINLFLQRKNLGYKPNSNDTWYDNWQNCIDNELPTLSTLNGNWWKCPLQKSSGK